jgi:hypothetical protein
MYPARDTFTNPAELPDISPENRNIRPVHQPSVAAMDAVLDSRMERRHQPNLIKHCIGVLREIERENKADFMARRDVGQILRSRTQEHLAAGMAFRDASRLAKQELGLPL